MFETNVFLNCPFDEQFRPILNSIVFCVISAGLIPRIATERADGGEVRLTKITRLMQESRYSIHDLSRCEAVKRGEISRLNMPFELGIDFGLRVSGQPQFAKKRFLVLDEKPHRLKQAISDISGWDTTAHEGNAEKAMKEVRNWLYQEAGATTLPGGETLYGKSLIFDEWKYGQPDHARIDVDGYSPYELIKAMTRWVALGGPEDPSIR